MKRFFACYLIWNNHLHCASFSLMITSVFCWAGVRGLGVLNREQFEVNPEEVHVTFDDVKGVSNRCMVGREGGCTMYNLSIM